MAGHSICGDGCSVDTRWLGGRAHIGGRLWQTLAHVLLVHLAAVPTIAVPVRSVTGSVGALATAPRGSLATVHEFLAIQPPLRVMPVLGPLRLHGGAPGPVLCARRHATLPKT